MKRQAFVFFLIAAMVIAVLPGMAFAHGHNRASRVSSTASYPLCSFENCHIAEAHLHGGTCYAGHGIGDGHAHHQVCPVQGCPLTTTHQHGEVTCFPHSAGDGHGYHGKGHGGKGWHR